MTSGNSEKNPTARLLKAPDASALAEELYLAILTRRPTAEERAEVAEFQAGREADRPEAVKELAWAMIASAEFRFNHRSDHGRTRTMRRDYACGSAEHRLSRRRFRGTAAGLGAGFVLSQLVTPLASAQLEQQEKKVLVLWLLGGLSQLES